MRYKYKAVKSNGERYEGILESANKFNLYNEIKAEGNMLISAEELSRFTFRTHFYQIFSFLGGVSNFKKINFAKNLSSMIKAGLPLSRALSVIERQTKNTRFRQIVEGVNLEIKKGRTLSEALKNYPNIFSNLFISMTKAGEESGGLSDSLTNVAIQMDKIYRLQKKVRGAMVYPTVIIIVMITIGILMFIFVLPQITTTFKDLNTELPRSTKIIIFISDFLTQYWLLAITFIIAFIFAIYFSLKTKLGKRIRDLIIIKLPLIGDLIKEANAARVARTLSSLLAAGVPVADSIQITRETLNNYYYRQVLIEAEKNVEKGENISNVFLKHPELYPTFVGEMMNVGEETGNMASMFLEVAIFYEDDVEERTKNLSAVIEPVIMVLIGAAVGFFAFSVITPIYSVMDNI